MTKFISKLRHQSDSFIHSKLGGRIANLELTPCTIFLIFPKQGPIKKRKTYVNTLGNSKASHMGVNLRMKTVRIRAISLISWSTVLLLYNYLLFVNKWKRESLNSFFSNLSNRNKWKCFSCEVPKYKYDVTKIIWHSSVGKSD
jgi:hypothetical protein